MSLLVLYIIEWCTILQPYNLLAIPLHLACMQAYLLRANLDGWIEEMRYNYAKAAVAVSKTKSHDILQCTNHIIHCRQLVIFLCDNNYISY